ncbi:MAG TPA: ATP-binding protein [Acidobacteriaceae bacterium]|nr:ATP-binding protein [Acidobacteriaceae bacterium]
MSTLADSPDTVFQKLGAGCEPQAAEKVFANFYTTRKDGMGIGLSVSRTMMESHHGRLWAELNDGPGATFSFSVPFGQER